MACVFSEVFNGCGCPIGFNVPLVTTDQQDITQYPVVVLNINEVELSSANSPSEYAEIWNADPDNNATGTLFVGGGAFCFYVRRKAGVDAPEFVLGLVVVIEPRVLATEDNDFIENEEDTDLIEVT